MTKLIAGNWKMNGLMGSGITLAKELCARKGREAFPDIAICPPDPLIPAVLETVSGTGIMVCGQDCHWSPSGPHTGDVSAALLADVGCNGVIVGHSERRTDYGETNEQVKAKANAAIAAGLLAIVCIGETEDQRRSGETAKVIGTQIDESLPSGGAPHNIVIAYEPVWAIGTGLTPSLDDIGTVHNLIRARAAKKHGLGDGLRIIYGGSVRASNAREILSITGVDGALVGGASLNVDEFCSIIASCH